MTTRETHEGILLPRDVRPLVYRLTLTPDFSRFTFAGTEEIDVEVVMPTTRVVLHAAEIEIHSVEWMQEGKRVLPLSVVFDEEKERVSFEFPMTMPKGLATLKIRYTGELNDRMCGFYRSRYSIRGEPRYMAVTQFEATDARRAFPCWDEPSVKAAFEVTLAIPADRIALSNTDPIDTRIDESGLKVVRFARTPVMSTYLLAFICGEFDMVEDTTREGIKVRVFTPVGKKEQGRFALGVATKTMSFYHDFFGVPYPIDKIDLIAIPDFAAGAMENWGAVTYRETALLVDPTDSSAATRQRVALVVAHELAHQWFGDLVTMAWWTDLWLNEGFASWIQNYAVDHLFPEWDMWTQFVAGDLCRALKLDGLCSTHPIEVEVMEPAEIHEIFDAVSYSKGASVIRMLSAFLGEHTFRRGLSLYLARHKFGNATTEDLWNALSEASEQPVKQIMDTWTKQPGYPVLCIEASHQDRECTLAIEQRRFFSSGTGQDLQDSQWWVPVPVVTEYSSDPVFLALDRRSGSFDLRFPRNAWIKLNSGQTGFFRVLYPPDHLNRLVSAVRAQALSTHDRIGIQNDAFALARAGLLDTCSALALAAAFKNETEYTVWADLSMNLEELAVLLDQGECHEPFQAFLRTLYRPVASRLGWESRKGEPHLTTMLRTLLIGALGHAGDKETIDAARDRFSKLTRQGVPLHPDLRLPVYSLSVADGGPEEYDALLAIYRSADLHEEKVRCLRALGYARDRKLLARTLELTLSREVRSQDSVFGIASVALNRNGRLLAWQFVKDNWNEIDRRYGKGGFMLARLISATAENFASEEYAREVEEFFRSHPVPAARRTIKQTLERIRSNTSWLARDAAAIKKWLEESL